MNWAAKADARRLPLKSGKQWVRVVDVELVAIQMTSGIQTLSWRPDCDCPEAPPVPAVILDPFAGSGTTLAVARSMGRNAVGFDIVGKYCVMARARRVKQRTKRPVEGQLKLEV